MTFTVYDSDGNVKNVTDRSFTKLIKECGLMEYDLDQFAITEDGNLIIIDECGRCCYVTGDYSVRLGAVECDIWCDI